MKKGYVIKEILEEDKRFSYIQLSDEIREHLEKDQQIASKVYENFLSVLNKNEREQLEGLLIKIKNDIEKNFEIIENYSHFRDINFLKIELTKV